MFLEVADSPVSGPVENLREIYHCVGRIQTVDAATQELYIHHRHRSIQMAETKGKT